MAQEASSTKNIGILAAAKAGKHRIENGSSLSPFHTCKVGTLRCFRTRCLQLRSHRETSLRSLLIAIHFSTFLLVHSLLPESSPPTAEITVMHRLEMSYVHSENVVSHNLA